MNKGFSYITITSDSNPSHEIIKALHKYGFKSCIVIYASMYSTDAGWTMVSSNKGSLWLGYTKSEAIKLINKEGLKLKI